MQVATAVLAKAEAEAATQEALERVASLEEQLSTARAESETQTKAEAERVRAEVGGEIETLKQRTVQLEEDLEEERANGEAASEMVSWKTEQLHVAETRVEELEAQLAVEPEPEPQPEPAGDAAFAASEKLLTPAPLGRDGAVVYNAPPAAAQCYIAPARGSLSASDAGAKAGRSPEPGLGLGANALRTALGLAKDLLVRKQATTALLRAA